MTATIIAATAAAIFFGAALALGSRDDAMDTEPGEAQNDL